MIIKNTGEKLLLLLLLLIVELFKYCIDAGLLVRENVG
jgi:hypothetical protein